MIPKKPLTILLAEDNEDDLWLMQRALKKAHLPHPPVVVRDGAETIAYLAGHGKYADRTQYPFPFVLLLDLKMPVKDGFDVLEWWRAQPHRKHLTIIVLTSSVRRIDIERAYALGATSYLCKPSELDDLSEMIERILEYWAIVQPVEEDILAPPMGSNIPYRISIPGAKDSTATPSSSP